MKFKFVPATLDDIRKGGIIRYNDERGDCFYVTFDKIENNEYILTTEGDKIYLDLIEMNELEIAIPVIDEAELNDISIEIFHEFAGQGNISVDLVFASAVKQIVNKFLGL